MTPRDPFEHLKNSNPVPPGMEPSAPMSMVDRIVGRRAGRWPAWAITVAAAAVVLAIGFASVLVLELGGGDDVAAGDDTTTSTVTDSTTTVPVVVTTEGSTTTVPTDLDFRTAVYFLADSTGEGWEGGPFLMPVERMVDVPDELTGTIQALLDGPTPGELSSIPMISTAIPDGATVNEVSVEGGIATVDLSAEFAAGAGSFSEAARIEQLVYTVTRLDGIDGMRLEIDGEPVEIFGGHGIVLDDPMVRTGGEMTLPAILIETPAFLGSQTSNPLVVTGTANVFEATISLTLTDADGLILWEGFTTATCGTGCRGEWEISIPYAVDEPQMGALIAWEESAQDGSQVNVREHRVWLVPPVGTADGTTTSNADGSCSGALVTDDLVDQTGLPEAVASTRTALFEAAIQCDWATLTALGGDDLTFTFGEVTQGAVANWQELEDTGDAQPMRYLAELLNRSYGTQPGPEDQVYYAWPSAFVVPWSDVTEEQREELRPLFGEEDFMVFDDFGGYIGDRIGILSDGTWAFFVAGD